MPATSVDLLHPGLPENLKRVQIPIVDASDGEIIPFLMGPSRDADINTLTDVPFGRSSSSSSTQNDNNNDRSQWRCNWCNEKMYRPSSCDRSK